MVRSFFNCLHCFGRLCDLWAVFSERCASSCSSAASGHSSGPDNPALNTLANAFIIPAITRAGAQASFTAPLTGIVHPVIASPAYYAAASPKAI